MADKIPNFTLTPQDAEWGRWVTSGITSSNRERARSEMELTAANKGLAASVRALAGQVQELSDMNTALQAQVDFLTNQTVFDVKATSFSNTSSTMLWPYDPFYDCFVQIMSGPSGRVWVTVTAGCTGSGIGKYPIVGINASWAGGSRAFTNLPEWEAWSTAASATRSYMIQAAPNTLVSITTQRGASTSSLQQIIVDGQTLSATRV